MYSLHRKCLVPPYALLAQNWASNAMFHQGFTPHLHLLYHHILPHSDPRIPILAQRNHRKTGRGCVSVGLQAGTKVTHNLGGAGELERKLPPSLHCTLNLTVVIKITQICWTSIWSCEYSITVWTYQDLYHPFWWVSLCKPAMLSAVSYSMASKASPEGAARAAEQLLWCETRDNWSLPLFTNTPCTNTLCTQPAVGAGIIW